MQYIHYSWNRGDSDFERFSPVQSVDIEEDTYSPSEISFDSGNFASDSSEGRIKSPEQWQAHAFNAISLSHATLYQPEKKQCSKRTVTYASRALTDPHFGKGLKAKEIYQAASEDSFISTEIEENMIYLSPSKTPRPPVEDANLSVDSDNLHYQDPKALFTNFTQDERVLNEILYNRPQLLTLVRNLLQIVSDPLKVAEYLQPLERKVKERLEKTQISLPTTPDVAYLIEGKGAFIPGTQREGSHLLDLADEILSTVLLQEEQAFGINLEGTPVYCGSVEAEVSNPFVAAGHLFMDNPLFSRMSLHGPQSHRIMFQAIKEAIKQMDAPLKDLHPKQLLNLLINVHYQWTEFGTTYSKVLWTFLIDTVDDARNALESNLDSDEFALYPENYSYSCRSPFVFSSLLTCFGTQLGLPALHHLLLHAHFKTRSELVNNLLVEAEVPQETLTDEERARIGLALIAAYQCNERGLGDISDDGYPGALDPTQNFNDPRYTTYPKTSALDRIKIHVYD